MPSNFLPPLAAEIQEAAAIALLHQLQRQRIPVLFQQKSIPIATAFVYDNLHQAESRQDAAPILLLHGFDSSLLEFRRLLPLLPAAWAIDLFGFGFTAYAGEADVNPQTIQAHLYSCITHLIRRPVILVGASMGGAAALQFALTYPKWVKAIVLIDSVGFSGSFTIGPFLPDFLLDWGTNWLQVRKQAALTAALAIADSELADMLRCAILHQQMPGWKAATAAFSRSGGYLDFSDRIAQLQHPTLILWGTADTVLGTADAAKFEHTIPHSRLVWIDQAGHTPHLDRPQQVAAAVLSFNQRLRLA